MTLCLLLQYIHMSVPRQEPAKIIESCFCKACDELLQRVHSDTIKTFPEEKRGFVAIQKGAADNCPFCLIIYRELLRKLPPNLSRDEYRVSITIYSLEENFILRVRYVDDDPDEFCIGILLQFVLLKDNFLRSAQLAASYEYPSKTDAPPVLELIRSWFVECRNHHAECKHSILVYHPPRLLEILGEKFRLVDSKRSQVEGSYATLSHCWGSPPPFLKLTSENIEVLQQWTPTSSLPKTFADAAKLCLLLSIKYLWIDSLCIIQEGKGSAEDWTHHVTEMQVIYSNGTLNIAASHAASSSEGLWTSRNPDFIRPSIIKGSNRYGLSNNQYLLVQYGYNSPGWAYPPLNHRAWVLQERLMSPRVVHFESEQVHWECHSNQMCETYPVGLPHLYSHGKLPSFTLPVKTAPAVSDQHWDAYTNLVEHHSKCRITYADTGMYILVSYLLLLDVS